MRAERTILILILAGWATLACASAAEPLRSVPEVDLERYAGEWYEIARLPNRFQTRCAGDVVVSYGLRDDGRIDVVNGCRESDGEEARASGVARLAGKNGPSSRLEVRFAPAFLSFLPAVWGDYWVIDLADDYSWAVVGEPRRRYLWILAREPRLDEGTIRAIVDRAAGQGYDLEPLIRTRQSSAE